MGYFSADERVECSGFRSLMVIESDEANKKDVLTVVSGNSLCSSMLALVLLRNNTTF